MPTTTRTEDFIGRALINASPGVTDPVRDYLNREVGNGDTDFMGRALVATEEEPQALYGLSDDGGEIGDTLTANSPTWGFVVVGDEVTELSTEYTHLLNEALDTLVEV